MIVTATLTVHRGPAVVHLLAAGTYERPNTPAARLARVSLLRCPASSRGAWRS
jgi:hypothetical protein